MLCHLCYVRTTEIYVHFHYLCCSDAICWDWSTLAYAMAWCLTAHQHWHLITDIDQHWPKPWHVTWRHQVKSPPGSRFNAEISQVKVNPVPDHGMPPNRCQVTTWANAEITCVNPLANTLAVLNKNTYFADISTKKTYLKFTYMETNQHWPRQSWAPSNGARPLAQSMLTKFSYKNSLTELRPKITSLQD